MEVRHVRRARKELTMELVPTRQGTHPIIPPFVVGPGEAVHYFRVQEVGEFVEGVMWEEAEGGVGVRNIVNKLGGVF